MFRSWAREVIELHGRNTAITIVTRVLRKVGRTHLDVLNIGTPDIHYGAGLNTTSAKRLLPLPVVGNVPAGVEKDEPHPVNGPLLIGLLIALKVFATKL